MEKVVMVPKKYIDLLNDARIAVNRNEMDSVSFFYAVIEE